MLRLVSLSLIGLALALPAAAQETTGLGTFKSWNGYSYTENGKKVCFMATKPTKSLPAGAKRGDIYAMITHRPAENSNNVVSIVTGYTYKKDSEVQVAIDGQKFSLFTDGDTAWARDDATDKKLSSAMQSGSSMTITGTSSRGTKTTDTYSLAGSGAAYKAISDACGVGG